MIGFMESSELSVLNTTYMKNCCDAPTVCLFHECGSIAQNNFCPMVVLGVLSNF
jgi:hypothetical protein